MKQSGFTIILIVVFSIHATCQNWTVYKNSNSDLPYNLISSLATDSNGNIWVGTGHALGGGGGLAKFDGENWTIYNTSNSDLPCNMVTAILPVSMDGLWVGTARGAHTPVGGELCYLQGENWTVYNNTNSELPYNGIVELAKDAQGDLWIGTYGGGLVKFDSDSNWTIYNTSNSGLPNNEVFGLAFDEKENLWVGTFGGLAMFDGENWTIYKTSNSDLPHNYVYDLLFDSQGALWIATAIHVSAGDAAGGIARFDGENWTVYNKSNSILPQNDVYDIKIDDQDNVWIGCGDHIPSSTGGLLKFDGTGWILYNKSNSRIPYNLVYALTIDTAGNVWTGSVNYDEPGGLVKFCESCPPDISSLNSTKLDRKSVYLSQNYPNPFNISTAIEYELSRSSDIRISIYNLSGQRVRILKNGFQNAGSYQIQWNGRIDSGEMAPGGVYFLELIVNGGRQVKRMVLTK